MSTLRSLAAADPVSASAIKEVGDAGHGLTMRVGEGVTIEGRDNIAVGRAALLHTLRARALGVGVGIETAHVEAATLDEDLIVAADGVRSATRDKLATHFGARVELDDALYLWAGADFALDGTTFVPAHTDAGVLVVHAYPYGPGRSTFLVETDEATWRRAGLQVNDARTPDGESDDASLEYVSAVFADLLGGRRLLGNRTRWQRFATIACARWSCGNIALLGDAAHTAHYSIGSGTKLAMEDAITLANVLAGDRDAEAALRRYESERRPRVERFQRLARSSHAWWKTFPSRMEMAPSTVMSSFITRTGSITVDDFAELHPDVVADAVETLTGTRLTGGAVADPDALADTVLRGRVLSRLTRDTAIVPLLGVDSPEHLADGDLADLVARARDLLGRGTQTLWLETLKYSDETRQGLLRRCEIAERLRLEAGASVGIDLPESARADAVSAVLTGRTDYVRLV